jgi:hypothetical protein
MAVFDIPLVKTFGQIAGIGGLSLLVFIYLFREVIRKNIFPRFTREHAYQIIRLFMILVFLLSLSGIGAWVYTSRGFSPDPGPTPPDDPAPKIAEWLKWIDDGSYARAWGSMPKQFQSHLSQGSFEEIFKNQRAPLGDVSKREFRGSNDYVSPEGYPPGHYQVRNYLTTFKDGRRMIEYVTVYGTDSGWKVVLHSVAPASASNI